MTFKLLDAEYTSTLGLIILVVLLPYYCVFITLASAFAGHYFIYGLTLLICVILFMILQRILDVINFNNPISLLLFLGD